MTGNRHFYIESFDTVQLSSFRVAQSPFAHRYATDQTVYCMYCDRLYPVKTTLDEDPVPNYWKLRRGVMLYDVPEMPLEIIGPDAARLLDRVLACRTETLEIGRARYGIACNDDGTVLMDGVVMRLAPDRFWYVKANGESADIVGGKQDHRSAVGQCLRGQAPAATPRPAPQELRHRVTRRTASADHRIPNQTPHRVAVTERRVAHWSPGHLLAKTPSSCRASGP